MNALRFTPSPDLPEIVMIGSVAERDARGRAGVFYDRAIYEEHGIRMGPERILSFYTNRGVLRGLHYQPGLGKILRCVTGAIYEVIVDIRAGSPRLGRSARFELHGAQDHALYVPPGFAHGYFVLSPEAHVEYILSGPKDGGDGAIRWCDSILAIPWPEEARPGGPYVDAEACWPPIVSERDAKAQSFADYLKQPACVYEEPD